MSDRPQELIDDRLGEEAGDSHAPRIVRGITDDAIG
jgi:hypothetical protein